jgi:hypothetical protein
MREITDFTKSLTSKTFLRIKGMGDAHYSAI